MVRCVSRRCVLHFLLLRYKKQGASYVFCLSEYIGREETEKESLVTFFVYPYSPPLSPASKHLFVKPSVAQFLLFVRLRLHVLPPHSQSNCAGGQPGQQGTRLLGHSTLLSLELRRV